MIKRITSTHKVNSVEERFQHTWMSGVGKDAIFRNVSMGWFVVTDDCIGIGIGSGHPTIKPGSTITIAVEYDVTAD